ncbi:MAG: polyphosphate polymerase domain-containing protein [Oscillospiraceae bacterium]|jgi:hypothetical protein|nr:polyphosphate polymerase domain-containing protein [Oscillospiraceae bacterium]
MAIEIFNRYENKYLISEKTLVLLQRGMSGYMALDEYNKHRETYPICNIYYDTEDSYLIRTSLSKPVYKEKLRLRSYGTPEPDSKAYVEIKKKFRGLVNKRRSAMKLTEAYDFLSGSEIPELQPYMNAQVLREAQYILARHRLKPRVYLSYDRRAFFGDKQSDLRVSFDTAIITRRHDLRLESGVYGESLIPQGKWLMEVKTSQSIPVWLARLLSEHRIYPISFSKYGAEYKSSLPPGSRETRENAAALSAQSFSASPLLLARA